MGNMPEQPDYRLIRRYARRRAHACYGALMAAFFPLYATAVGSTLLRQLPSACALWAAMGSLFLHLLSTPLMVGAAVCAYEAYLFGVTNARRAFRFYRNARLMMTAALLKSVLLFFLLLSFLPAYLMAAAWSTSLLFYAASTAVWLLLAVVYPWVSARLLLTSYLFCRSGGLSAPRLMRESFQRTRGRAGGVVWFAVTIAWLPVLACAAMAVFVPPPLRIPAAILPIYLFAPYLSVAIAGCAQSFLPPERAREQPWPVNQKM